MRSFNLSNIFFLAILLAATPSITHAAVIANATPSTNNRFAGGANFIGDTEDASGTGFDFSGVGRIGNTSRWATRIGDNYFLSANHNGGHPMTGDIITYHTTNDLAGTSHSYAVAGGLRVGTTDLWLGWFNESIDSSIKTYTFNTTAADSLSDTGLANKDLFMMGNYNGGTGVGMNQAESWSEEGTTEVLMPGVINNFSSNVGFDQLVIVQNEVNDTAHDYKNHESLLVGGDSGSPLFSYDTGSLIIQGIAFAVTTGSGLTGDFDDTNPGFEQRHASFYTYTGSYVSEINTAIASVPNPVPEPSTSILIAVSGLILLRRKREF